MKKSFQLISFALAGLALYFTFRNISYGEIKGAMFSVHYIYVIYAIILILLTFYIRAVRWKYLIRPLKKVTPLQIFPPLMIGFMGNMLPARAGEFIRAFLLGKKTGLGFSASFATVFVERIFDLLVLLLLLVWLLLFKSHLFAHLEVYGHSLEGIISKFGWGALGFCIALILFCYLLIHATEWIMKGLRFFTRPFPEHWRLRLFELVHSFKEGLGILTDYRSITLVFLLSLLEWFFIILSNYPFFVAFDIHFLPFTALIMVTVIIGVFIALFPTPGYLGAFQLATVVALHKIYGVSEPVAASYGVLTWLINMGVVAIFGCYYIFKEKISFADLKRQGEEVI